MDHRPKRRKFWKQDAAIAESLENIRPFATASIGVGRQSHSKSKSAGFPAMLGNMLHQELSQPSLMPPHIELPAPSPIATAAPTMLYKRQDLPAVQTVVESIVQVIVDSGTSQIAEFTLDAFPTAPTVVSLSNHGAITVPALTTFPIETAVGGFVTPFPTLSNPTSTVGPGCSSQVVLSSPPATPLPTNQEMTIPSTLSTGTFKPSVSTMGNSSVSTFTSTGSGTTSTGSPTLSSGYFAGNSTRTGMPSNSSMTAFGTGFLSSSASSTMSTSSFLSTTTSPSSLINTAPATGAIGGNSPTGTGLAGSAASSTAAAAGGSTTKNSVPTPAVVGGVVGGVAGITIILVFLLFLLRWKRRKMLQQQDRNVDTETAPPSTARSTVAMAERAAPLAGTGLVPFLRKLRPHSVQTASTTQTASTERGFQNLGGRKLESVLVSGGDGYGGKGPGSVGNVSSTSFYRDSQGTYGGPGSLPSSMYVGPASPPSSPLQSSAIAGAVLSDHDARASDKEVAILRPGPSRTPVRAPGFTTPPPRMSPEPEPTPPPLVRPDGIGRSHPSLDGSRGSKFAEDLG